MYNFPFFPHFYPRPYYSYPQNANARPTQRSQNYKDEFYQDVNNRKSDNNSHHKNTKSSFHNNVMKTVSDSKNKNYKEDNKEFSKISKNDDYDNKIIEILGIKLHQDDIILICLIFFLYQEGVKDEFLFIALILLLLT